MIILPWLFSNLVLGQDALNPADLSTGTLAKPSFAQSEFSRVFHRYSPFSFDRGILDFWLNSFQHAANTMSIDDDADGLNITINVQQCKPEEVTVKVIPLRQSHLLVIRAKHEEQDGTNITSQQSMMVYRLPKNIDVDKLTYSISGCILTIKAPRKSVDEKEIQSTIPSNSAEQAGTEEAAVEQANV